MSDQDTALALIASLKLNQKGTIARLRDAAHVARKAGQTDQAKALTAKVIALTRQNLVLHRATVKVRQSSDLTSVNRELMRIVTESNKVHASLEKSVDVLGQAAKLIDLLRRTITVITQISKELNDEIS